VSSQQQCSSQGLGILSVTEVQVRHFELVALTRNEFGYYYFYSVTLPMLLPTGSG
jgi:hypothetical protein